MKVDRKAFAPGRKEQRMRAARSDSYRATAKDRDPRVCPRCRATYMRGRWTWRAAAEGAATQTCPACLRIEQDQPGGFVSLGGSFFHAHRDEILALVAAHEQRTRAEHPMQRIIGAQDTADGVLVTTTDAHLARGLGVALQNAFQGDLDIDFAHDENLARVAWKR